MEENSWETFLFRLQLRGLVLHWSRHFEPVEISDTTYIHHPGIGILSRLCFRRLTTGTRKLPRHKNLWCVGETSVVPKSLTLVYWNFSFEEKSFLVSIMVSITMRHPLGGESLFSSRLRSNGSFRKLSHCRDCRSKGSLMISGPLWNSWWTLRRARERVNNIQQNYAVGLVIGSHCVILMCTKDVGSVSFKAF